MTSNVSTCQLLVCMYWQVGATCVTPHPSQRHLLLAGGEDGSLTVWDLRENTSPATLLSAHSQAGLMLSITRFLLHNKRIFNSYVSLTCDFEEYVQQPNSLKLSFFIYKYLRKKLLITDLSQANGRERWKIWYWLDGVRWEGVRP